MKQTILLKQQKTMHVKNESFSSINLGFKAVFAELTMPILPHVFDTFSQDVIEQTFVTATLKGQSVEPIRIFDNISLRDIYKEHYKGDFDITHHKLMRGNDANVDTLIGNLPLPLSPINLTGEEVLELDVRVGVFTTDVYPLGTEMESVDIEISTSESLALQSAITTIERITLDDDYKKKYELSGNVTSVAFCQDVAVAPDFVDAVVTSDIFETELDIIGVMANGVHPERPFGKDYIPLLKITAPIKNTSIDLKRARIADSNSYLLVRKTVISQKAFARHNAKSNQHMRENQQRVIVR